MEKKENVKSIDNPPNNVTYNGGFSIYPTPNKSDTIKGIGYIRKKGQANLIVIVLIIFVVIIAIVILWNIFNPFP